MLDITRKHCLFIFTFVFMMGNSDIRTVATPGILPDGSSSQIGLDDTQETVRFLLSQSALQKGIQMAHYQSQNEEKGGISRRKRNVLFPSGVKLCSQETVEQAIANHLDYFHLRVCQETVWEAFKIFWDRLPERNEYQDWMTMCREGRASTLDIGTNFSQSSEHMTLVHRRMPLSGSNSEASNSWLHMCSLQTTAAPSEPDAATTQKEKILWPETFTVGLTPEATQEVTEVAKQEVSIGEEATTPVIQEVTLGEVHEVTLAVTPQTMAARTVAGQDTAGKVEEDTVSKTERAFSKISNEIELDILTRPTWSLREQMVELSIQLKGEVYSDALKDPFSFYYQRLAQQFIEKIEDAFERLPGFKNVAVLEFRPQRDAKGDSAVVVHYVVTLEVDGGISKETLDYINLQSNLVGNSYHEVDERPTVVYTITDFRNYITEALHKENFIGNTTLAVDPNTLQLENVESLVPPESSIPSKSADDMDNILTAENRLNLPGQDLNNNEIFNSGFNKDDFLIDSTHSSDPWMGSQEVEASENDVIILDESPALPPPVFPDGTFGVNLESTPISENTPSMPIDDNNRDLEEEGLLYGNKVVTTIKATDSLERGKIAIEMTPGAGISDIAGPTPEPPGDQGEKSALHLFDTGSGSGLAGEELGPLLPMAATVEDGPVSDGDVQQIEEEKEEEDGVRTETSSKYPVSSSDGPHLQGNFESVNEPLGESLAPSQVDLNVGSDLDTNTPVSLQPPSNGDEEGVQIFEMEEGVLTLVTEGPSVEISEEERAKDEILVVSPTMTGPPVPETQSTASPTLLSPEESHFTLVTDFVPEITPQASSSIPHSPAVELRLTTQSPFYQPTLRPTEDLFGAKVPSSEEGEFIRITFKPAFIDPTMPNDQGNQDGKTQAPGDPSVIDLDHSFDVPHYGEPGSTGGEGSSGYPSGIAHGTDMASVAKANNGSSLGRALMVFFSLRVTNMMFSEDLFNKSSPEYKALEQRFLELLVPYLQSNLSNFQNLEILNFRNGSIVVNSRMKFGKPVPRGVTNAVYLILEDFCNTAYQTMNLAIDKYSLDVESGEQADPCKFQACNEFSECTVNRWSGEAECVCNAGYFSVDGLPCQSVCDLRLDFCMNDGKCDIIPGQGAICRCRVGENWWYRGEHCEEYVSEPLVVGIAIASVAGFLLVASGVIFFLARTLRDQYDKDETEDPIRRGDSMLSLERATKYNPMYESDITTGYSHYYRRYPEMPCYSSASAEASTDFSSEEIRHIYENSELTREEIQDRIRIIELYAKDRQFADFVRQHQVSLDIQRESSST